MTENNQTTPGAAQPAPGRLGAPTPGPAPATPTTSRASVPPVAGMGSHPTPVPGPAGSQPLSSGSPSTSSDAPKRPLPVELMRMAWGAVVLVALLITWFALVPAETPELSWDEDVQAAEVRADTNNRSAQGAPQQTVLNGWHAADLAAIQIDQLQAQHEAMRAAVQAETRTGAMVLVVGIGLAGDVVLRAAERRQKAANAS